MHSLELEIREQVAAYLRGRISLEDLYGWLQPRAWDVERTAGAETARLAHGVDLLLAEFQHGDWTEAEAKDHLWRLLEYSVDQLPGVITRMDASTRGAAWSQLAFMPETPPLSYADIRFAEASG